MRRIETERRPDWQQQVEKIGFVTHTSERGGYWDESACWVYSEAEMDKIEADTLALHSMCLSAVDHIVKNPSLFRHFAIPEWANQVISRSWRRSNPLGAGDPSLMGRMDLAFDGRHTKLIEYNADCPALLLETSVVQWDWLMDKFPEIAQDERQFNIIHDYLRERFIEFKPAIRDILHISGENYILEEKIQMEYLAEIAREAGLNARVMDQEMIGLGLDISSLFDEDFRSIKFLYKMYPWEWMFREPIGPSLVKLQDHIGFIEPPWKMLLSSKAILPILWSLYPSHPLLLPSFFDYHPSLGGDYVVKPVVGWEGRGVRIESRGRIRHSIDAGPFAKEPMVFQKLVDMQVTPGQYTQTCSWMVGDRVAAVVVREDETPIISTLSRVVPHYWE